MSGIFKGVKKVFKGVVNVVKKVWKPILIAAAIYFGGWALYGMSAGVGATAGMSAGLSAATGGAMGTAASTWGAGATAYGMGAAAPVQTVAAGVSESGMGGGLFAPESLADSMYADAMSGAGLKAEVEGAFVSQTDALASGANATKLGDVTAQVIQNQSLGATKASDLVMGTANASSQATGYGDGSLLMASNVAETQAPSKLGGMLSELKDWAKTPMGTFTLGSMLSNYAQASAAEKAANAARRPPRQYYGFDPKGNKATVTPVSVAPAVAVQPAKLPSPGGLLNDQETYMQSYGLPSLESYKKQFITGLLTEDQNAAA